MSTEDDEAALHALVRRYRELGSAIAELKGEQEEIKKLVDSLVDVGWKTQVDGVAVHKRGPNRSFCPTTAASLLDTQERESCVVTRFDEKKMRAFIEAKGMIEECMVMPTNALPVVKL